MARLRAINNVSVLTFEERTRVSNFFMLLVEIDFRLPKTAKTKARKTKPAARKSKGKPIKKDPCTIKCPAMCCSPRTARRDLYLKRFTRIFKRNKINSMGYWDDRHHCFIANT